MQKKCRNFPGPCTTMAGQRGQATVEFILTLVIALLIITVIILPAYDNSSNYVLDVSNLAKLRVSADKLVDSLQYAYVSGNGTKQTIEAVVPQSATLSCKKCTVDLTTNTIICTSAGGLGNTPNSVVMAYGILSKNPSPSCIDDDDSSSDPNGMSCKKIFQTGISSFTCIPGSFSQGIYTMVVQKDNSTGAISVAGTKIG